MNVIADAEAVAETVAPQLRVARWAVYLIGLLVAAAVVGFLVWWVVIRPRQAHVAAATARVEAATSAATAGAAQDTTKITLDVVQHRAAIDVTTQENARAIYAAPRAADSIGADLDRVGRAALCLRDAYQSDPGCSALRRDAEGGGAAPTDTGNAAAGQ